MIDLQEHLEKVAPCDAKTLYRFVDMNDNQYFFPICVASLEVYEVLKETEASYFIDIWYSNREKYQKKYPLHKHLNMGYDQRWIRKSNKRPFARETIEDALKHYIKRKTKHIQILEGQLKRAKQCHQSALNLKGRLK